MSIIQGTSKAAGGATYEIDQSIRFNKTDSAILSRTPSSTSNQKTYTISFWFKIGQVGHESAFFIAGDFPGGSSPLFSGILLANAVAGSPSIMFAEYPGGAAYTFQVATNAVFKDPSAWYHFIAEVDTTQATASNRIKLYVNGELQTDLRASNYPSLNYDTYINSSSYVHRIGRYGTTSFYADGYMAEINFIDGTALDATSFGETNDDGVWIPKAYTGSYGTNGFYITGETASDLGEDFSGNNNDFTSSGLATTDQMLDTPTLNWCTLNPNDNHGSGLTLSDGNLRAVPAASAYGNEHGTFYVNSGKWVFEVKNTTVFGEGCGWSPMGERIAGSAHRGYFMLSDGRAYINTSNQGTKGASLASGDYRYIFYDADLEAMWFAHVDVSSSNALVYDNSATKAEIEAGTTTNAVFTSIQDVDFAPGLWMDTSGVFEVNFGQSAFITSSDLPTGFNTLNTANLATPSITDGSAYFQTKLYTGQTTGFSPTFDGNSDLAPDWLWFKRRDAASDHFIFDKVRGATKALKINSSAQETTLSASMTAFGSDGFTLGDGGVTNDINGIAGATYVAWGWSAGNDAGSTNSDGTITSTVSVNQTSGFSIAKYVGNATAGATIGHGLGAVPSVVITKMINSTENGYMQHVSTGPTKGIAMATTSSYTGIYFWDDTAPTSSVFSLGYHALNNGSGKNAIAYCFAPIPGYSSFGSYTGNSSTDGPFVYTGFKPALIMTKRTDSTSDWTIVDTTRSTFNLVENALFTNLTIAEDTTGDRMDILSNGFKLRTTQQPNVGTLVYMAFAENPFGGEDIAPATAR